MRAQPLTLLEVKEQWVTIVIEAVTVVESVVANCTQLFEKLFEVLTSLQEDPNIQRIEMEAHEL